MEFDEAVERFRRELLAHCYRMLGSIDDAEDLVQETFLRAWRSYDTFDGRASLRTWLYRIATNACLTALQHHSRRWLPSGLADPTDDPDSPIGVAPADTRWLQPAPTALLDDPAELAALRHSTRLALIASMQYLPPRQRAVLILRDVLAFPAAEVATVLDTTTAAVKSTLQRARATLRTVAPAHDDVAEPAEPAARAVLDRYMAAFERSDAAAIEQVLREDAVLEMTPCTTWFNGRVTCLPYIVRHALGSPGEWRMTPTTANGQPAALADRRGEQGWSPFALAVLSVRDNGIARISLFGEPSVLARFRR
ncbi:MAG TPA: RNA polymerase subunit sigma-70 [Pseudonocardiaceae bacterium]|nr:RNA polymerase subunit sigma-70 [Pseudonocardiaceae bacterium]